MKETVTRLAYCQYLLVSQINYTLTNFADHCDAFSHDAVNRYLRGERITPRLIWDNVRGQIVPSAGAYLIFDDTVLDKSYSQRIELVRRQWQASDRAGTVPMPQSPDSTQPHRLCLPGLGPTQALGGPNRSHRLSTQAGLAG
jgi:hypothetical protein